MGSVEEADLDLPEASARAIFGDPVSLKVFLFDPEGSWYAAGLCFVRVVDLCCAVRILRLLEFDILNLISREPIAWSASDGLDAVQIPAQAGQESSQGSGFDYMAALDGHIRLI